MSPQGSTYQAPIQISLSGYYNLPLRPHEPGEIGRGFKPTLPPSVPRFLLDKITSPNPREERGRLTQGLRMKVLQYVWSWPANLLLQVCED